MEVHSQNQKLKQSAEFFNEKLEIILADFSTRKLRKEFTVDFEEEFLKQKNLFQIMQRYQDVYQYEAKTLRLNFKKGFCEGSGFETREEFVSFIQGCLANEKLVEELQFFLKQKLVDNDFQILNEEGIRKSKQLARQEAYKYLKALYVDMPVNVALPKKKKASIQIDHDKFTAKPCNESIPAFREKMKQYKEIFDGKGIAKPQKHKLEYSIEFFSETLKIILQDLSKQKAFYSNKLSVQREFFEKLQKEKNRLQEKLKQQTTCQYGSRKLRYSCTENLCEGSGFETEKEFVNFVQGYISIETFPNEIEPFLSQKLSQGKFQIHTKEEVEEIQQLAKQAAQSHLEMLYDGNTHFNTEKNDKNKTVTSQDYKKIEKLLFYPPDSEYIQYLSKAVRAFSIFLKYVPYRPLKKQRFPKEQKTEYTDLLNWLLIGHLGTHRFFVISPYPTILPLRQEAFICEFVFQDITSDCTDESNSKINNIASNTWQILKDIFGPAAYELKWIAYREFDLMIEELLSPKKQKKTSSSRVIQRDGETYAIILSRDVYKGLQIHFKSKTEEFSIPENGFLSKEEVLIMKEQQIFIRLQTNRPTLSHNKILSFVSHINSPDTCMNQKDIQIQNIALNALRRLKETGLIKHSNSKYVCTQSAIIEKQINFEKKQPQKSGTTHIFRLQRDERQTPQLWFSNKKENLVFSGIKLLPEEDSFRVQKEQEIVQLQHENPVGFAKAMRAIKLEIEIVVLAGLYGSHGKDERYSSSMMAIYNLLNERSTKAEMQNPERKRLAKELTHVKLERDEIELNKQELILKKEIEQCSEEMDAIFNEMIDERIQGFQAEAAISQLAADSPSRIIHHCLHTQEATSQPGHFIKEIDVHKDSGE